MSWREHGERGSAIGATLMRRLTDRLPRRLAHGLIPPVALYFLATAPRARRASGLFLARALGRKPGLADLYRHFTTFSAVLVDRMYLLRDAGRGFEVRLDGRESEELSERYRNNRDGFFVMSAHMGNFEIARVLARGLEVPPVHMVMFEENARKLAAALQALDPERAAAIIALGRPDSMLKVNEALDAGGIIGMLPDRLLADDVDPAGVRALPFLGAPARFPIGPFRMAALMRRPVLLQLGLYEGGNRYRLVIEEVADFRAVDRASRAAAVEQALATYVARLEFHARQGPYNWFNFFDYWEAPPSDGQPAAGGAPAWKDGGRAA